VVYAAQRPKSLSGLLLLGPGLTAEVKLSPARQLQVVVGHLVAPTACLPIPLTPELYTANPPYLDFIRADPLRRLEATAQFFWETARLDRQRRRASARLALPLLLLQGEADKMIDVPKTRRWFARLGIEDKTYRAYPDRRPYSGLRTGPRPVPGRPARVAVGAGRIRAVSAELLERIPSPLTLASDLGNGGPHSAEPSIPDKDEAGGSSPPRPTTSPDQRKRQSALLESARAGIHRTKNSYLVTVPRHRCLAPSFAPVRWRATR
jgi:hypothetical protein